MHRTLALHDSSLAACSLMILSSKIAGLYALYPSAAVPSVCMSLEALWSKHSSRSVRSSARPDHEVAVGLPSRSTGPIPAVRESRKRPAELDVPQQNKIPKRTSSSFPTGVTDLGFGSSIIFQPKAFNLSDSQRLYKALKVGRRKHCTAAEESTALLKHMQHILLDNPGSSGLAAQRSTYLWKKSDAATPSGIHGKQYQFVIYILTHKDAPGTLASRGKAHQGLFPLLPIQLR